MLSRLTPNMLAAILVVGGFLLMVLSFQENDINVVRLWFSSACFLISALGALLLISFRTIRTIATLELISTKLALYWHKELVDRGELRQDWSKASQDLMRREEMLTRFLGPSQLEWYDGR